MLCQALFARDLDPYEPPYFKLDQRMSQEIAKGKTVGAAVAVFENGKIEFVKSYGLRKKGEPYPVDSNTVFQLGSVSKTFTASLYAIAIKQKRLSLSSSLILDKKRQIKAEARHLLSHSSGFSRNGWNWQIENSAKSREELLALFEQKKQHELGKRFDYHNVAFSFVEKIIEDAFKMPFNNIMENNLIEPLSMTRTSVGFDKFKLQNNRAWPHERKANGQSFASSSYSYRYHEIVPSAGGVNSSINDMATFLKLQLGQYPELVASEDLAPFHSPVLATPNTESWFKKRLKGRVNTYYGYGFRILNYGDQQIVFHGGWLKGFRNVIAFSPETGQGIVVLSNTESNLPLSIVLDFFKGKFKSKHSAVKISGWPTAFGSFAAKII